MTSVNDMSSMYVHTCRHAGVLSSLMHQHTQMQLHQQLLEAKLSQLQQHTQAVHDSYSHLISRVERGELSLEPGGLVGLSRNGSSPPPKKQRTEYETAGAATQQPADSMFPAATQQDPFSTAAVQTAGLGGSQGGTLAGFSLYDAGGDAAAAGTNGVAYNRRQRQQQQTRQEAVKQRLLNEHRQLQQDWQGRLGQILRADNLQNVQHLLLEQQQLGLQGKGSGRQNSGKPSGDLAAGKSGVLSSSQQQQADRQPQQWSHQAAPAAGVAAAAQALGSIAAADGSAADLLADDEEDVPELTAATARHVVRRATRHVNPLLGGRHRRH